MKQSKYAKFIYCSFLFLIAAQLFSQATNTRKWRKSENDSMQIAAMLFEDGKYSIALPFFENLYTHHPKEQYLKYCYGKCALTRSDKHPIALTLLDEVYQKNKKINNILYDLAQANHLNLKFDEALVFLNTYLENKKITPDEKRKALQLKQYCVNGKHYLENPTTATITNIGNNINTENEEYVPIISADESIMIFTYRGKNSMGGLQNESLQPDAYGMYFEDAYQTTRDSNGWMTPKPIKQINTNTHDAPIGLSVDGKTLFVYRDIGDDHGDIYSSQFLNDDWTIPQKLKGEVNSYSWEGSCSMTSDGKQLYFSSERFGGLGGKDIYRATLLADSTWGNIVNLGDSINTTLDDDAPYIHPDGVTLFYSSQAKNSMGGFDILQAQLNPIDSTFSQPINLGYPINTPDDDIYYVLSANGETGYYASGKVGGQGLKDIYTVSPGYVGQKPFACIVKGIIKTDSSFVDALIKVEIIDRNNKVFGQFQSSQKTGDYLFSLPKGAEFKLTYTYENYSTQTFTINTKYINDYTEYIHNVNFKNLADTIKIITNTDTLITKVEVPTTVKPEVKKIEKPIDKFKPNTLLQAKIKDYSERFGDITAPELFFTVQIAAFKYPKNYAYKHLNGLGKVENLLLDDGITRITIGGKFDNLKSAYEHNKKVVLAGQTDAFVTVLYKGKRIFLEDLESMGIFVTKP